MALDIPTNFSKSDLLTHAALRPVSAKAPRKLESNRIRGGTDLEEKSEKAQKSEARHMSPIDATMNVVDTIGQLRLHFRS